MLNILENIGKIEKPRAILLDWDNTLADSWKIIHKCLNNAFRELGKEEWTIEEVIKGRDGIHHSLRESFPRIFGEDWEKAKNIYFSSFLACHLQEISLLPGALESIKAMAHFGAHIAIVSNKTGIHLRNELKHLGIDQYFDAIIGATDAAKDKPFKEPLILALKNTGIIEKDYGKVWMFGDSGTDVEAAHNTGVIPVVFANYLSEDVIKAYEEKQGSPLLHVNSHAEFQLILEKLK